MLPGTVHETMLAIVRTNLEPYHRALAVRRESLGVETLQRWDLDVTSPAPYRRAAETFRGYAEQAESTT